MNYRLSIGKLLFHLNKILQAHSVFVIMWCQLLLTSISLLSNFPRGSRNSSRSHGLPLLWENQYKLKITHIRNLLRPDPLVSTQNLKLYRNKLNHLLKIRKKEDYNNYFFDYINDCKRIWKGVKQIVNYKPLTSARHIKFIVNDCEIVSPIEVANTYFSLIGNNLTKSISIVEKSPMEYLRNPVCDSFFN